MVEALDVAVDDTVDRVDVVEGVGRAVLGAVVLGETGVLLLEPLAGDAVRVRLFLADTLDVAVFLVSSTLDFATGGLDAVGLAVEGVGFDPKVLEVAPTAFGLVAGALVERGVLVAVVGVVLVVSGLVEGLDGVGDFAAMFVLPAELLDAAEEPDVGLLFDKVVEPEL